MEMNEDGGEESNIQRGCKEEEKQEEAGWWQSCAQSWFLIWPKVFHIIGFCFFSSFYLI